MATQQAKAIRREEAMNRLTAAARRVATDRGVGEVNLNTRNKDTEIQEIERIEAMATFLESIASPMTTGAPAEPARNWGAEDEPDGEVGDAAAERDANQAQPEQTPAQTEQQAKKAEQAQQDRATAARVAQTLASNQAIDDARPAQQRTGGTTEGGEHRQSVSEKRAQLRPSRKGH